MITPLKSHLLSDSLLLFTLHQVGTALDLLEHGLGQS